MELDSTIPEVKEAYKNIQTTLGEERFVQYQALLKLLFSQKITKLKFDEDARKFLSPDQIHAHNLFVLSLESKLINTEREEHESMVNNIKYCAQEMCLPNEDLVKDRVTITALDHGLEGAEDAVTDIIIIASQMFLKNIITVMASRIKGYKIRENNFQHTIGIPAPNPWLRNTNNIIDPSQETNINISEENQTLEPNIRPNLEAAEQQTAFSYACANQKESNRVTLKCLYDTLIENPHVINHHSIRTIALEKIITMLDSS